MLDPNDRTEQLCVTIPKSYVKFIDKVGNRYNPVDEICPGRRSGVVRQIIARYMKECKKNEEISQQENCNRRYYF